MNLVLGDWGTISLDSYYARWIFEIVEIKEREKYPPLIKVKFIKEILFPNVVDVPNRIDNDYICSSWFRKITEEVINDYSNKLLDSIKRK